MEFENYELVEIGTEWIIFSWHLLTCLHKQRKILYFFYITFFPHGIILSGLKIFFSHQSVRRILQKWLRGDRCQQENRVNRKPHELCYVSRNHAVLNICVHLFPGLPGGCLPDSLSKSCCSNTLSAELSPCWLLVCSPGYSFVFKLLNTDLLFVDLSLFLKWGKPLMDSGILPARLLYTFLAELTFWSCFKGPVQEDYIQKIHLPAYSLEFYADGRSLHIFNSDGSCATKIPLIRAGVSYMWCCALVSAYLVASTWLRATISTWQHLS